MNMDTDHYLSWGRFPQVKQSAERLFWRSDAWPLLERTAGPVLPFGNGRSYGDCCLNEGGVLIDTRGLNRFMDFDPDRGVLRCEAGILLSDIHNITIPHGWFLKVTPGTQFITVGGAIANDVHGKNHHRAGTFGRHVVRFELLRSDGSRLVCSAAENTDLFRATIGGLGLTGLILWAEIQLRPITNPVIEAETLRFRNLDEFFELSEVSGSEYEYTVAWVDCIAKGTSLGRGLFFRGNHAATDSGHVSAPGRSTSVPMELPLSLVNGPSLRLFNFIYYHRPAGGGQKSTHYLPFFYPLDSIHHWNRIYGPRGFMQYQCVVPVADGRQAIREILERIARSNSGSFLAVIKVFGDIPSPGLMSFPRPGVTLALDFPNRGKTTLDLLERLDEVVRGANGAVYAAKDARMSSNSFRSYFPALEHFRPNVDPRFSSSLWRRVMEE